jgi:hypothetical protein
MTIIHTTASQSSFTHDGSDVLGYDRERTANPGGFASAGGIRLASASSRSGMVVANVARTRGPW